MNKLIIALLFFNFVSLSPASTCSCGEMMEPPTVILPYIIDKIENGEYFGSWWDGTQLHFSKEDITTKDDILVGDTVLATYNRDNLNKVIAVEFFFRDLELEEDDI